jgi:hypothetical protein
MEEHSIKKNAEGGLKVEGCFHQSTKLTEGIISRSELTQWTA